MVVQLIRGVGPGAVKVGPLRKKELLKLEEKKSEKRMTTKLAGVGVRALVVGPLKTFFAASPGLEVK